MNSKIEKKKAVAGRSSGRSGNRLAVSKSNGRGAESKGYIEDFTGFSKGTFDFLAQLYKHNSVTWFRKHRAEYEEFLLAPARSFVVSIGPFIKFINPTLDTEPKFNRTLVRINRDMRFAKKPYKDFMLIRFGKSKWDSELFLYIDRNGMEMGTFINNEKVEGRRRFEENLSAFKELFLEACKKYKIGSEFSAYELHYGTEPISERFRPVRDHLKFKGVNHIIFGREIKKSDPAASSAKLLAMAMKTFNRLYPLYIFSTSENPAADLESYNSRIGLLKISSK